MPSGYLKQRRRYDNGDTSDVDSLNLDLQDVAARLGGRLDQHNFMQNDLGESDIENSAYQEWYLVSVPVDHAAAHNTQGPQSAATDAMDVPLDGDWHVVSSCQLELVTGECVVVVRASAVWASFPHEISWNPTTGEDEYDRPRPVFGLRIGGAVHMPAITGLMHTSDVPPVPVRLSNPKALTTLLGTGHLKAIQAYSEGSPFCHVRLKWSIPLPAGVHGAEFVVRAAQNMAPLREALAIDAALKVYTRKMLTRVIPRQAPSGGSSANVAVPAWESGDTFSRSSYRDDRLQPLVGASNAITSGMVARAAFNHAHLPSSLKRVDVVPFVMAAAEYCEAQYPGWGSSTPAGARTGATGWWQIDDAGVKLETSGAAWATTSDGSGLIHVLADVGLTDIRRGTGVGLGIDENESALFALGYHDGTNWVILEGTISPVAAGPKIVGAGPALLEQLVVERNVALEGWIDMRGVGEGLGLDITKFGVFVSSMCYTSATVPRVKWRNATLTVMHFGMY